MPKFLIKSNHIIIYTADVDVELPENKDDLAGFMEKYEEEFKRLMPLTHASFVANGRVAP